VARIFSTLGVATVLRRLNLPAEIRFDPTARLLAAIAEGARADIAILTDAGIEALTAQGILAAGTRRDLAHSYVGIAVPPGAPHPRFTTVEEWRQTLQATPSLAYSRAGASGLFFAEWLEAEGLAAEVNARATIIPHGFTAELAARGEVALAIQQVSELMAVEGVEVLGKLPEGANTCAVFSAALFAGADPSAAGLLDAIAAAMTPEALRAGGLECP